MRKILLPALLVAFLAGAALAAEAMSVPDLFENRKALDGKPVTVTGTVKNYYEKPDFSACLLFDSGKAVSVYFKGHRGLQNDTTATVSGTFWLSQKIDGRFFSNVVVADEAPQ